MIGQMVNYYDDDDTACAALVIGVDDEGRPTLRVFRPMVVDREVKSVLPALGGVSPKANRGRWSHM